jgi:hypothetical protein
VYTKSLIHRKTDVFKGKTQSEERQLTVLVSWKKKLQETLSEEAEVKSYNKQQQSKPVV